MTPMEEVEGLLTASQSETQYRTVTSRAYFAAYNVVISLAEKRGFTRNAKGDDHQRLVEYLKFAKNDLLRRIGFRLARLRSLRNRADYVLDIPFGRGLASEAAQTARELIGWVDSLVGKVPNLP
jgi:hypothetical protein